MGRSGRILTLGVLVIVAGLALVAYNWVQVPLVKFDLGVGQCKFGPPLAGFTSPSDCRSSIAASQ